MEEVHEAFDDPGFPEPLFFHQASVEAAKLFFAARLPGAHAVADPDGFFYDAFGLRRGNALQLLGPGVWLRGLRAAMKGHFVGRPTGDPLRMPGTFLVRGRSVMWQHRSRHAGDHPDLRAIPLVLRSLTAREAG